MDTIKLSPTYQQMLQEAGRQISLRKRQILSRVALYSWPGLISVFLWNFFLRRYLTAANQNSPHFITVAAIGIGFIILTIIYVAIFESLFNIEKRIWIDSFFDNKNLSPKDSWKIARKLFWKTAGLELQILLRYYLGPILLLITYWILAWWFLWTSPFTITNNLLKYFLSFSPFLGLAGLAFYLIDARIKLRNVWFLFLDQYGPSFTYKEYFKTLKELNQVSKTDTFNKALIAEFGTAIINELTKSASNSIGAGLRQNGAGGAAVSTAGIAINELTYQILDFGKLAAIYLLYKFARKQVYKQEQSINDNLYKLAQ